MNVWCAKRALVGMRELIAEILRVIGRAQNCLCEDRELNRVLLRTI